MSLKRKVGKMTSCCSYSTLRKRPKGQGKIAKLGYFSKSPNRMKKK